MMIEVDASVVGCPAGLGTLQDDNLPFWQVHLAARASGGGRGDDAQPLRVFFSSILIEEHASINAGYPAGRGTLQDNMVACGQAHQVDIA